MAQHISNKPIRKVTAGAIGGASITVVLWMIKSVFKVDVPAEVASAMTVLLTFAVSYQTRAADDDLAPVEPAVRQAA